MTPRRREAWLAASLVDDLRARELIVLVKGGLEGLTNELSGLMASYLERVPPELAQRAVFGEVTSTFGSELADEAVEQLVDAVADALMDSDHVEDVFAEDKVLRRDIFRAVRDGLLRAVDDDEEDDDEAPATNAIRLATLGYVAKSVASAADVDTLRDALERAADEADAELIDYEPTRLEATFAFSEDDPDLCLDLEQAIVDELEGLVDLGFVDLPTIERRMRFERDVAREERPALGPRIDAAAAALRSASCGASWMFLGETTLSVTFTPLAEPDMDEVEARFRTFADAVTELIRGASAPPNAKEPPAKRAPAKKAVATKKSPAAKKASVGKKAPAAKKQAAKKAPAAKKATKQRKPG